MQCTKTTPVKLFEESGDGHLRAAVTADLTVKLVLAVLMLFSEPAVLSNQFKQSDEMLKMLARFQDFSIRRTKILQQEAQICQRSSVGDPSCLLQIATGAQAKFAEYVLDQSTIRASPHP